MLLAGLVLAAAVDVPAQALEQVSALLDSADAHGRYVSEAARARLTDAGLDEGLAIAALGASLDCQCRLDLREPLLAWLEDYGSEAAYPVLVRAEAAGDFTATRVIETRLTERMLGNLGPCAAPDDARVAELAGELADFTVIVDGPTGPSARWPTAQERDDLAYFLASVEHATAPIERVRDRGGTGDGGSGGSAEAAEQRESLLARFAQAERAGELGAMRRAATRYLSTLGWPDELVLAGERDWAWGGARASYVARDLARTSEMLGDDAIALELYEHADPGGGACGTSIDYHREQQTKGFIRAAEQLGRCELTVAMRLLDWDGRFGEAYGPERLARAGFDLERIYRGALVTRDRDDDELLARAWASAADDVAAAGRARRARRGNEAWERRVWAIEGLLDELGRPEVPTAVALLAEASPALDKRIVAAIGELEAREHVGRCPEGLGWFGGGSFSTVWSRPVDAVGHDCPSELDDRAADRLAQSLIPGLRSDDLELVRITAVALGRIASPRAVRSLRRTQSVIARRLRACGRACTADDDTTQCPAACRDLRELDAALGEALTRQRELAARNRASRG